MRNNNQLITEKLNVIKSALFTKITKIQDNDYTLKFVVAWKDINDIFNNTIKNIK